MDAMDAMDAMDYMNNMHMDIALFFQFKFKIRFSQFVHIYDETRKHSMFFFQKEADIK